MKEKLRSQVKNFLHAMSKVEIETRSLDVSSNLFSLLDTLDIDMGLGIFYPLNSEVQWHKSLPEVLASKLCFPAGNSREMKFYLSRIDELRESLDFGVKLLTPSKTKEVMPEVLVIPGLAFSPQGERLGRGGGFYDRYLSKYEGVKIGICFHDQLMDFIPTEEHDQTVDFIVTDKKTIRCS